MKKINKRNLGLSLGLAGVIVVALILVGTIASPTSMLYKVLQMGAIYALLAVTMNLLNGFTGLFSLGQAGFMTLGAYTFAVLTIPVNSKAGVYYLFGVTDALKNVELPWFVALIIAGAVSALFAFLIGMPMLRLKSDYFAIATLGFAEVVRIVVASKPMNRVTNGSMGLTKIPGFSNFFVPFIVSGICIAVIALIMRSTYGRAFKAVRDDEIAAESMGINLSKTKLLSFVISSFFAGIGGALMTMFTGAVSSTTFTIAITYFILLIVVIGGMSSITGSVISAFIVISAREWWLRFLDQETYIGSFKVPLLRTGFRMVVFSVILMIVVLFFKNGLMGNRELSWDHFFSLFKRKKKDGEKDGK
mgnify:CR=1 FL=1